MSYSPYLFQVSEIQFKKHSFKTQIWSLWSDYTALALVEICICSLFEMHARDRQLNLLFFAWKDDFGNRTVKPVIPLTSYIIFLLSMADNIFFVAVCVCLFAGFTMLLCRGGDSKKLKEVGTTEENIDHLKWILVLSERQIRDCPRRRDGHFKIIWKTINNPRLSLYELR